jgi:hypothetical protein
MGTKLKQPESSSRISKLGTAFMGILHGHSKVCFCRVFNATENVNVIEKIRIQNW